MRERALKYVLMVPGRFHTLNRKMRELANNPNATADDYQEWKICASELSDLIKSAEAEDEILAEDLRRGTNPQNDLSNGKLEYGELLNLISIYQEPTQWGNPGPGRWSNITTGVQRRLVCRTCARG